jgi:hypothetical protein
LLWPVGEIGQTGSVSHAPETSYADLPATSKSLGPASWRGGWDRRGFAFQALQLFDLLGGRLPASRLPAQLGQPLHSACGDVGELLLIVGALPLVAPALRDLLLSDRRAQEVAQF